MTAFDMHGASVTVLNLSGASNQLKSFLEAPCFAPSWVECDQLSSYPRGSLEEVPEVAVDEATSTLKLPSLVISGFDEMSKSLILKAVSELSENEPLLTKYDTIVGDGDCGITMKRGAQEIERRLKSGDITTSHPVKLFADIA